jgi:glycosyltransferase involved in cell wall biosynthesis
MNSGPLKAGVSKIKLTVAIPTYNRNEILHSNLNKLLPQLGSCCELLIIDNSSTIPIETTLGDIFDEFSNVKKRIIRNRSNVGGNENILRCIENATGDFVWILGDDDPPVPNAITNILAELANHPDTFLLNMYTPCAMHALRNSTVIVEGSTGYLGSADFLGELMFISALVFRVDKALENMSYAHLWQASHAPQLIVALLMLRPNGKAVLSCKEVAHNGGLTTPLESQSSAIPIALGFSSLLYPLWNEGESQLIMRHLQHVRSRWITPMGILNGLVSLAQQENIEAKYLALRYYYLLRDNFFALGNPLSIDRLIFICAWPLVAWPKLGYFIGRVAWRILKGKHNNRNTPRSLNRG